MKDIWRVAGTGTEIESGLGQINPVEEVVAVVQDSVPSSEIHQDSESMDIQERIHSSGKSTPESTTTLEVSENDVIMRTTPQVERFVHKDTNNEDPEEKEEDILVSRTPVTLRKSGHVERSDIYVVDFHEDQVQAHEDKQVTEENPVENLKHMET